MSMEQLAYLAEIVGVFGVVASLIYVGRQLHQNTIQMKVSASSDRLQWYNQFQFKVAEDRDFAELWCKGDSDFSSLDEVDKVRLQSFESAGIHTWAHWFELYKANLMPEHHFHQIRFLNIGDRESVRETWEMTKSNYAGEFRKFISKYMQSKAAAA